MLSDSTATLLTYCESGGLQRCGNESYPPASLWAVSPMSGLRSLKVRGLELKRPQHSEWIFSNRTDARSRNDRDQHLHVDVYNAELFPSDFKF